MEKKRILVDGVWYVEDTSDKDLFEKLIATKSLLLETADVVLEASIMYRQADFEELFDDSCSIKLTNKHNSDAGEYIDNPNFIRGVADGKRDSMEEALTLHLEKNGLDEFVAFCKYLKSIGWV